jgi:hypothetical protein
LTENASYHAKSLSRTFLMMNALGLTETEEKIIQNSANLLLSGFWFVCEDGRLTSFE